MRIWLRTISLLTCSACLVLVGCSSDSGAAYDTPEEAATAYVQALATGDAELLGQATGRDQGAAEFSAARINTFGADTDIVVDEFPPASEIISVTEALVVGYLMTPTPIPFADHEILYVEMTAKKSSGGWVIDSVLPGVAQ